MNSVWISVLNRTWGLWNGQKKIIVYFNLLKGKLKIRKLLYSFSVRTRRYFDIHTTSFQRYGRCMDIETTLYAYWIIIIIIIFFPYNFASPCSSV